MNILRISDSIYGWTVVFCSTLLFQCISLFVSHYFTPNLVRNRKKAWYWKNIAVSFIHSMLAGPLSLTCYYLDSNFATDMINHYTTFSLTVMSFSLGYFIHDTIDTMRFEREKQSFEILLHHVIVNICFGIAVTLEKYVEYANVALIIEVNSIFLHKRQLMQMYQVPRTSVIYKLNSLINLGTFIMFRVGVLLWMIWWMLTNKDRVPLGLCYVGSLGLLAMTVINKVLFYRLLCSDYLRRKDHKTHVR